MNDDKNNLSNDDLRRKAEELLSQKIPKILSEFSESGNLKLLHELEVYQIELELQNKELIVAKEQAEAVTDKYIDIYDFAPVGYFTLSKDGKILGLNLPGSQMLCSERSLLINKSFALLVSEDSGKIFNLFLDNVFKSRLSEICEITLPSIDKKPIYIQLSGRVAENSEQCFVTATDITEIKLAGDKIKNLLSEKELLLKEVHHRIKNNMNTIIGLFSLQVEMENDKKIIDVLNDAKSRVQVMMMLYEKLYSTPDMQSISINKYLTILTGEIIGNFPNCNKIKTNLHIDDFIIKTQKLIPVGIIINELITNMMKYAFNDRESGTITITAALNGNHAAISIQDDGGGMPESISFENSTGFGMQLVSMLAEQIEGSIRIERGEGTKFVLELDI